MDCGSVSVKVHSGVSSIELVPLTVYSSRGAGPPIHGWVGTLPDRTTCSSHQLSLILQSPT